MRTQPADQSSPCSCGRLPTPAVRGSCVHHYGKFADLDHLDACPMATVPSRWETRVRGWGVSAFARRPDRGSAHRRQPHWFCTGRPEPARRRSEYRSSRGSQVPTVALPSSATRGGRHEQHSGQREHAGTPSGHGGHEARGGRHPGLGRRPREGVLRRASGGGSTPTSPSTTASGVVQFTPPGSGCSIQFGTKIARPPRPARRRAST